MTRNIQEVLGQGVQLDSECGVWGVGAGDVRGSVTRKIQEVPGSAWAGAVVLLGALSGRSVGRTALHGYAWRQNALASAGCAPAGGPAQTTAPAERRPAAAFPAWRRLLQRAAPTAREEAALTAREEAACWSAGTTPSACWARTRPAGSGAEGSGAARAPTAMLSRAGRMGSGRRLNRPALRVLRVLRALCCCRHGQDVEQPRRRVQKVPQARHRPPQTGEGDPGAFSHGPGGGLSPQEQSSAACGGRRSGRACAPTRFAPPGAAGCSSRLRSCVTRQEAARACALPEGAWLWRLDVTQGCAVPCTRARAQAIIRKYVPLIVICLVVFVIFWIRNKFYLR